VTTVLAGKRNIAIGRCKMYRFEIEALWLSITLVYMDFAVLMLNLDKNEVLCADSRNVVTFVLSHTIF
jgi:hypothetical protein